MKRNSLGMIGDVRRWTGSAIDCYKRGCVCKGCQFKNYFESINQKCQMKATVLELVRVNGAPEGI